MTNLPVSSGIGCDNKMRVLPTKQQWAGWTLPSKATYVAAWLAVVSILLAVITMLLPNSSTRVQIDAQQNAVVQAPVQSASAVIQNMSDSPGAVQVAGDVHVGQQPRHISLEQRESLISQLSTLNPMLVVIWVTMGDAEAALFAKQIESVFERAKWPLSEVGIITAVYEDPVIGCQFTFKERPPESLASVLVGWLDSMGEPHTLFRKTDMSAGTLSIVVGAQRRSVQQGK